MAVVVNVLTFEEPIDPGLFERAVSELAGPMRAIDGFRELEIVQSGEAEVVLLISADTVETLDRIATEVGSLWMVEHVVPLLAGPPQRHLGPVIASTAT
jgi:hypothetical protein